MFDLPAIRAIEALRAGVPSRYAVQYLGTLQRSLEAHFDKQLSAIAAGADEEAIVFQGDFGTGKSHLLASLESVALNHGFVTSRIVISKETPLHDPMRLYRAAIAAMRVPQRIGDGVEEIASVFDTKSERHTKFQDELAHFNIDDKYRASLWLFEHSSFDLELKEKILRFWSGELYPVGDLRSRLQQAGGAHLFDIVRTGQRVLGADGFWFMSGLVRAAGYPGWVIFVDEVELIGQYSLLQRARSYMELGSWMSPESRPLGIYAVFGITSDFESRVIYERGDGQNVIQAVGAKLVLEEEAAIEQVRAGLKAIEKATQLEPVSTEGIAQTYRAVRSLHGRAYRWDPPDLETPTQRGGLRLREYVRSWINEWDLIKLDPDFQPSTQISQVEFSYDEDESVQLEELETEG